jgi:hypothetical protein
MLHLHRSTAIPDNRNMNRRHPPASRSSINHARGPDSRPQAQRFALFPIRMDIGGAGLALLQRIHVIVESDFSGCIVDEMKIDLAAGLQGLDRTTGKAEREGKRLRIGLLAGTRCISSNAPWKIISGP